MNNLARGWRNWTALLFLGLLSVVVTTGAQEATKVQTKHCFWKVEGKSNAVYLLGSVHVLNSRFYPMDRLIEDAFKNSQTLVLEVNLKDAESPAGQMEMLKAGMYGPGDSVRKHVSKETYGKLDAHLKKSGSSASSVESFKPWMISVVLLAGELQKLGFNPMEGVDRYFFKKAEEDGKKVEGLETAAFQLSLFNQMSQDEEDAMLNESFDEVQNLKKEFNDIISAWQTGDAAGLDKLMVEDMRKYPELYKKLLLERNQRWVKKMDGYLKADKDIFVVVGALHLVGKDSVVEMLRAKGYKVEQR
jgi:uncharacterized protein YbaP (TraB family)